jgi:hypothetical protein
MDDFENVVKLLREYRVKMRDAEKKVLQAQRELDDIAETVAIMERLLKKVGAKIPDDHSQHESLSSSDVTQTRVSGYSNLGFRGAVLKALENFPGGAKAANVAEFLATTDADLGVPSPDLSARINNDLSKLVKKGAVEKLARGVFRLAQKAKSPDAPTSGLFISSANGSANTDAGGSDQQGGY